MTSHDVAEGGSQGDACGKRQRGVLVQLLLPPAAQCGQGGALSGAQRHVEASMTSSRSSVRAHTDRGGCFWLATRPGEACGWDGAGGQVSVGAIGPWGRRGPMARLVITGLESLTPRAGREAIQAAFRASLLTDEELAEHGPYRDVVCDGFEPWLGAIRLAARSCLPGAARGTSKMDTKPRRTHE
jgi:hypothetical protein